MVGQIVVGHILVETTQRGGDVVSARMVTLTIAGFLVGALASGGIGVRVIREVRALDDATSLPLQNIARSDGYHVDPHETIISSVALVPETAALADAGLTVAYRLASLAPSLGSVGSGQQPVLYPKAWKAEALGGAFEGSQADLNDAVVVFPLLAGGNMDQIDAVSIVEAFIPAPFEQRFLVEESEQGGASFEIKGPLPAGLVVEVVEQVVDRDATTLVLRVQADPDLVRDVRIVGDGPGYHPAIAEDGTVTLTREDDGNTDVPAGFSLVAYGTYWVRLEGEFPVDLGEARE